MSETQKEGTNRRPNRIGKRLGIITPGVIPVMVYKKLDRDAPVPRNGESGITYHLRNWKVEILCLKQPRGREDESENEEGVNKD